MSSWEAFRLLRCRLGRGADIDLSKDGQGIEDRELSPTSAGHPRREDEDETNELKEEEAIFEGKSRVRIRQKFASERRGRRRRGVQSFKASLVGNCAEGSDTPSESEKESLDGI